MDRQQEISRSEIIDRLRELPLKEVPDDLTRNVMQAVSVQQPGLLHRLWSRFNTTVRVPVKPSYAFCLLFLLIISFYSGRNSIKHQADPRGAAPLADMSHVESAQAAYLMGRGLLAAEQTDKGLALLQKAAHLEPENPEFAYWEGIGYWLSGNRQQERSSYIRGLSVAPGSVPLLINLGHSYLSENKLQQALETYHDVLKISPDEPVAWYNSALIYRNIREVEREKEAWKNYLKSNRTGRQAFRAVKRLNEYGDFSYRPYRIGARKLILSPALLFDQSASTVMRKTELLPVTTIIGANQNLQINVVVFLEKDIQRAKERAHEIKKMLVAAGGPEIANRVTLSWFDSPEKVLVGDTTEVDLAESLLLFSSFTENISKEVAI